MPSWWPFQGNVELWMQSQNWPLLFGHFATGGDDDDGGGDDDYYSDAAGTSFVKSEYLKTGCFYVDVQKPKGYAIRIILIMI